MYIRKSKETKSGKVYQSHRLVESVRINNKPLQRTILNLGANFSVSEDRHKELCGLIQEKLFLENEAPLIPHKPSDLDMIAGSIVKKIVAKQSGKITSTASAKAVESGAKADFATVDLNSLENDDIRSFGGEAICLETINRLGIPQKLIQLGFTKQQKNLAIGSIVSRLLAPGSDRASFRWLREKSSLGELLDFDFYDTSLSRFYEVADIILDKKNVLEKWLYERETDLFSLNESIVLYDLTNTFLEGSGKFNSKAKFGRSKEKRTDALLVTMGLVLDGQGFPRKSTILPGNVSEPSTLKNILEELIDNKGEIKKRTVVMDAGIATEDNLDWLRKNGFVYVVVARNKIEMPEGGEFIPVSIGREDVKAKLIRNEESSEWDMYVDSAAKAQKESSMKSKICQRFETDMKQILASLSKKRGTKELSKVHTRIGRVKERYKRISGIYDIKVIPDSDEKIATKITWDIIPDKEEKKLNGIYRLRTNEEDISVEKFWKIYINLTQVESSFRCMKSELGIRPVHHQKGTRVDAHLFITLLAYHISHSIRYQLRKKGITSGWKTIRETLSSHVRVSTTLKDEDSGTIHIRKNSRCNSNQKQIYNALGIFKLPGKIIKAFFSRKKK